MKQRLLLFLLIGLPFLIQAQTFHTISIDGSNAEWSAGEKFSNISTADTAYFTWDADNLYFAISDDEADYEDLATIMFIDTDPRGNLGSANAYSWGEFVALPFRADYAIVWKNKFGDDYIEVSKYNNTSFIWEVIGSATATDLNSGDFTFGIGVDYRECKIKRSFIGSPDEIKVSTITEQQWGTNWRYYGWPSAGWSDADRTTGQRIPNFYSFSLEAGQTPNDAGNYNRYFSPGHALAFDGTDDYVKIEDNAALDLTNDFTIEFWIKPENWYNNNYTAILTKGQVLVYNYHIGHMNIGSHNLRFSYYNGGQVNILDSSNVAWVNNRWYHVAIVADVTGNMVRFFRNGELLSEIANDFTTKPFLTNTDSLYLGILKNTSNDQWDGMIDELRIWNSARTEVEIAANWFDTVPVNTAGMLAYYRFDNATGSGSLFDETSNNLDGTLENMSLNDAWVASYAMVQPANLTTSNVSCGGFSLNWENSEAGATPGAYYIDVASDSLFTNLVVGYDNQLVGDTNSFNVTLASTGKYFYRVYAWLDDITGQSTSSIEGSVTTQDIDTTFISDILCANDSIQGYSEWFSTAGIHYETLSGASGCDSVVQYDLTYHPVYHEAAWNFDFGGTGSDYSNAVVSDADGNVYVTGYFANTVDFDPSPDSVGFTAVGTSDIFLAKYNRDGSLNWVFPISTTGADYGNSLTVKDGFVYLTGSFGGSGDFDPGTGTVTLNTAGGDDVFLAKYDTDGNYVWAFGLPGTSGQRSYSVSVDNAGNSYITGYSQGATDFDPGTGVVSISTSSYDVFVASYDAAGNYRWAGGIGGASTDIAWEGAIDGAANFYITGYFKGTVDFDISGATYNVIANGAGYDVFLASYDSTGAFNWAKCMGGTSDDYGKSLFLGDDFLILSGYFKATTDLDPGAGICELVSAGDVDGFFGKYDLSGNLIWAKSFGSDLNDRPYGLDLDADANIYLTGLFSDTCDFDASDATQNLISAGGTDVFYAKYDAEGNLMWVHGTGDANDDRSNDIFVETDNSILVTGYYQVSVTLDPAGQQPQLSSEGSSDCYVLKLWPDNSHYVEAETCSNDSLMLGGSLVATAGFYYDTYSGTYGCDSILITNLSVKQAYVTPFAFTVCEGDSIFAEGVWQHNSGVFRDTLTALTGCDSIIETVLTVYNNYLTPVDENICQGDSILLEGIWQTIADTYYDTLQSAGGCDSIVETTLSVYPNFAGSDSLVICEGDSILVNGVYEFTQGTYSDTLLTAMGCDSIIEIDLTVTPLPFAGIGSADTICHTMYSTDLFDLLSGNYDTCGVWVDSYGDTIVGGVLEVNHFTTLLVWETLTYQVESDCGVDTTHIDLWIDICDGIADHGTISLVVFPNPVNDVLTITAPQGIDGKYSLKSIDGRELQNGLLQTGDLKINMSGYAAGVYVLVCESNQYRQTYKITKE
ncbi:MAG: T9SS type A sorting domain-containing protein [Bacteroidetes bacterium]|nr:T9SS type A sorting domain-containing protein [Bacteroidota bacterium]MBU1719775.1 T9SS type A sorting domain-containing protein [Bacteroidota bacterium]